MKKIAYVLHWDARWGSGIIKKVVGQVCVWLASGHDVRLFMLSPNENVHDIVGRIDSGVPITSRSYRGMAGRFIQYEPLARMAAAWKPDLVYLRYAGCYPALVRLTRRIPSVFEINTDDVNEYRLGVFYRGWYNRLTRRWLLSQARGMVFVSGEVARKPHFTCFGKPTVVIGNGIDLAAYEPLPAPHNRHPRLIFIAGSSHEPWQGIDKICTLAEQCPTWEFDLVGVMPAQLGRPAPPNLRAHGFLDRPQYQRLFARADVAIGALALHRKQMHENSTLKFLEYLAFSIPTIIAHKETDFPDPHPYILRLPNTETNVVTEIDAIRRFVERMRGRRVPRDQIAHLDVRQKELRRLEFFEHVLTGGVPSVS